MNKKVLIGLIVVIIICSAMVLILTNNNKKDDINSNKESNTNTQTIINQNITTMPASPDGRFVMNINDIVEQSNTNNQNITTLPANPDDTFVIDVNDIVHQEGVQNNTNEGDDKMSSLNIQIGNKNFTATLYDNDTTRELLKQLPLTVTMSELNGNEKYYYFNQSFPTDSERIGNIKSGDLMLYGADCLVLFYKNFSTSYSYTKLGYINDTSGLDEAVGSGNIQIIFSKN